MKCTEIVLEERPVERFGHICVLYAEKYLILWGGFNYDPDVDIESFESNLIWVFDTEIEKWTKYETKNDLMINRCTGSVGLIANNDLYIFGGFNHMNHLNTLFKLNLSTFEWTICEAKNGKLPSPRDKFDGWVYDNKLYYFGGFGPCITDNYLNEGGSFVWDPEFGNNNFGWNNQLIYYDIQTQTWHNPAYTSSQIPEPRAAHKCTLFKNEKVYIFGGRTNNRRTNDLFILDLQTYSWSENVGKKMDIKPSGRSWMVTCKLSDNEIFMYGGFTGEFDALNDAWIFNTDTLLWTQLANNGLSRCLWHTCVCVEKNKQIYVYGGCFTSLASDIRNIKVPKNLVKISISPESLTKICIDLIRVKYQLLKQQIDNSQNLPLNLQKILKKLL